MREQQQWYVLKVVSKQEEKVKSSILSALSRDSLLAFLGEIVIPYEKVYEVRSGKKRVNNRVLFPGYLFICLDLSDGRLIQILRGTSGVLGFLNSTRGFAFSKSPVPLKQEEVDRVIGRGAEVELVDLKLKSIFVTGETVEIIDGPFSGFTGKVQEIFEERKTISVTVKIFDERSTPVELSYTQVKKCF